MSTMPSIEEIFHKYRAEETRLNARLAELDAERDALLSRRSEVSSLRQASERLIAEITGRSVVTNAAAEDEAKESAPAAKPVKASVAAPAAKKKAGKAPAAAVVAESEASEEEASSAADSRDEGGEAGGDRRKGRRKAAEGSRVHKLGIVDAAVELARQKGIKEADAGMILGWFKEVGYKRRNGIPTRNSIYVSLNREFKNHENEPDPLVFRPDRGTFVFNFDKARH